MPVDLVERLHAITRFGDNVALALEEIAHDAPQLILILHQEDLGTVGCAAHGTAISGFNLFEQLETEPEVDFDGAWRRRPGHGRFGARSVAEGAGGAAEDGGGRRPARR